VFFNIWCLFTLIVFIVGVFIIVSITTAAATGVTFFAVVWRVTWFIITNFASDVAAATERFSDASNFLDRLIELENAKRTAQT
jgi:hypothetical protein